MKPVGYLIQQHGVRLNRPVMAYDRWTKQMPNEYKRHVLGQRTDTKSRTSDCIATVKHYRSLIPLGQNARKPIFNLSVTDGAFGSHAAASLEAFPDFSALAKEILRRAGIPLSDSGWSHPAVSASPILNGLPEFTLGRASYLPRRVCRTCLAIACTVLAHSSRGPCDRCVSNLLARV